MILINVNSLLAVSISTSNLLLNNSIIVSAPSSCIVLLPTSIASIFFNIQLILHLLLALLVFILCNILLHCFLFEYLSII